MLSVMAEREIPFPGPNPNVPGPFQDKVGQAFLDYALNMAFFAAKVEGRKLTGCAVAIDNGRVVAATRRRDNETPDEAVIRVIERAHRIGLADPVVAIARYVPTRRELSSQKS